MSPRILALCAAAAIPALVSGCQSSSSTANFAQGVKSMVLPARFSASSSDRECLMRAMFFESNRSSRDGLVAVGTVVMNRLRSGQHGNTICEVVGERGQFAPGVMTRPMNSRALPDVEAAADAVLRGERHPKVKNAMFFHTAGRHYPYRNMYYVLVAGGNAFYEKRRHGQPVVLPEEKWPGATMIASNDSKPAAGAEQPVEVLAMAGPAPSGKTARLPLDAFPPVPKAPPQRAAKPVKPAAAEPAQAEPAVQVAEAQPVAQPLKAGRVARPAAAAPAPIAVAALDDPSPAAPGKTSRLLRKSLPATSPSDALAQQGWSVGAQPVLEDVSDPVLSFGVDQSAADAIGNLISSESRPE